MAHLETSKPDTETRLPYTFEVDYLDGNSDLYVTINLWHDMETNPWLRFYSHFGQGSTPINTFNALIVLKKCLEWENMDFEMKDFIKWITVENLEWSITIEYKKDENKVIFTIQQLSENNNERFRPRKASIVFILENEKIITNELAIQVKKNVFDCLANLQHAMLADKK